MKSLQHGEFAMPIERGEVQSYNVDRMVFEFTLLNQRKVILCAISTAAMDDLEGRRDVKPDERVGQFMRLRDVIEERASRKFFEEQAQADRPVVLRSNDFSRQSLSTARTILIGVTCANAMKGTSRILEGLVVFRSLVERRKGIGTSHSTRHANSPMSSTRTLHCAGSAGASVITISLMRTARRIKDGGRAAGLRVC
jgi:uncharacterized protein DUF1488